MRQLLPSCSVRNQKVTNRILTCWPTSTRSCVTFCILLNLENICVCFRWYIRNAKTVVKRLPWLTFDLPSTSSCEAVIYEAYNTSKEVCLCPIKTLRRIAAVFLRSRYIGEREVFGLSCGFWTLAGTVNIWDLTTNTRWRRVGRRTEITSLATAGSGENSAERLTRLQALVTTCQRYRI